MIYLYIFLAISLLSLVYMRLEAGSLKLEHIRFTKSKSHLKIIQISDMHIKRLKIPAKTVKRVIENEKPDMVIITGDFIEKKEEIEKFFAYLDEIGTIKNAYVCLGNHDHKAFKRNPKGLKSYMEAIISRGYNILHNQSACFEKNGRKYNIIGIADIRYGHDDIEGALSTCSKYDATNIAFAHNPDIVLKIPGGKVDYLLCGHFHGGQIWMPFNLEFKLLRDEKLSKMGISRGLHKFNGINLYINRGLGNVCLPFRFMSRPEITVLYVP